MKSEYQKLLIALVAIAAIGWWAWQKYEWVDEKKWIAADTEIRKRPLYAAGLFLDAMDFSVARIVDQKRFDDIDSSVGTLFICEGKTLLSEAHFQEVERWVRQGGHLVINSAGGGQLNAEEDDEGQQAYGIRSVPIAQLYYDNGISLGNVAASQDCWQQDFDFEPANDADKKVGSDKLAEEASTVFTQGSDQVLHPTFYRGPLPGDKSSFTNAVQFEGGNWLQIDKRIEPDWQWGTERGVQLYSLPLEAGRLTVTADFSPFFNRSIGLLDNAYALQTIVEQGNSGSREVWFHERELAFPSLRSVLWQRAPHVVLVSLLFFTLLLWLLFARRLEPVSVARNRVSQLRAQMHSIAFYRWRVGDVESLYKQLEQSPYSANSSVGAEQQGIDNKPSYQRSKKLIVESAYKHWQLSKIKRGDS